tara:strand:+ start:281 stop:616 length:336 start_codon:yes stop_codon:yes gene_type:complete
MDKVKEKQNYFAIFASKHKVMAEKKKKSATNYAKNPESRKVKAAYDKKYDATPARRKRRAELVKANRDAGTYGNGDGLDMSHTKKGKLVKEKASTNRARNKYPAGSKKNKK